MLRQHLPYRHKARGRCIFLALCPFSGLHTLVGASPVPRALPDSYQPLLFLLNTIAQDCPTKWNWGCFSPLPLLFQRQPILLGPVETEPFPRWAARPLERACSLTPPVCILFPGCSLLPFSQLQPPNSWNTPGMSHLRASSAFPVAMCMPSVACPSGQTGQPPVCDSHPALASRMLRLQI